MSNSETRPAPMVGGLGFCGALTLLFIALQLTGHIDWSVWLLVAPLWVPASLVIVLLILGVLIGTIVIGVGSLFEGASARRAARVSAERKAGK